MLPAMPYSERLSYRLMNEHDGDLMYELDQNPAVMRYISPGRVTTRDDITSVFIPRMLSYRNADKGWGLWQVNTRADDAFIGFILVRPMYFFSNERDDSNIELGWRFKENSWGHGYGSEAARHVADFLAAHDKSIQRFSAIAHPDNTGSIHIMKKLGMTFVRTFLHQDPLGDTEVVHYEQKL
ncbi:Protein N-acetyltransferase, RimJ/RimL family [Pseudidiomarina planktonica]|uniref:Protein N-acetyltransferase, RimJ/RimL family n=1 Tax=Pseudidiomarina planktonica TaxID=1323738 RepID=A0A1Y6FVY9_9GAMM|nr:GNAT family N-acetyltransferase [Pseudidiomarina planktonica]RUO63973.1 N-acetyltransferase [Pseudidiomarina planktonica]SMQ79939.1 Protein N-acetyltransferase, RimJ/RimL family [Pseudidiomarina planktonica]